ncbi:hypothetical protein E2562_006925 [Oryza meyeriana var. granulata]|uniref:Uncharacterized protein n=1 Tax=Oryza meyeriana var. granulata TaxID=110450 RepID=A0A6G1BJ29_9ORYZ|nr:hypothetical protein E2562_006925 [Oryza meyeriana var. granulata]
MTSPPPSQSSGSSLRRKRNRLSATAIQTAHPTAPRCYLATGQIWLRGVADPGCQAIRDFAGQGDRQLCSRTDEDPTCTVIASALSSRHGLPIDAVDPPPHILAAVRELPAVTWSHETLSHETPHRHHPC